MKSCCLQQQQQERVAIKYLIIVYAEKITSKGIKNLIKAYKLQI